MSKKIIASILAGFTISIGAVIYLLCSNKIVGASLFAVGILMVMEFKFLLFTGYVPTQRDQQGFKKYLGNCGIVYLGNIVGAFLTALLLHLTRLEETLSLATETVCNIKLNDDLLSIFILSFFCGIIIAAIVKATDRKHQILYVVMMIVVFILSTFEHVVANAFYLSFTYDILTIDGIIFMIICGLGNFVGGFLYSYVDKLK